MRKILLVFNTLLVPSSLIITTIASFPFEKEKIALHNIITKNDLGLIKEEKPGKKPTKENINNKLHSLFPTLRLQNIYLKNITLNTVCIVGDNKYYTDEAIIESFQIPMLDISALIVNDFDLGPIRTNNQIPTNKELKNVIATTFKTIDLDVNHINIENIDSTSAIVRGDNILYHGSSKIFFSIDKTVDLATVITQPTLTVKTNGKPHPDKTDIETALIKNYKTLAVEHITITSISNNNVTITVKDRDTIYHGQVQVSLLLDTIIDLANIINNGLPKIVIKKEIITKQDVLTALQQYYPILNCDDIILSLQHIDNQTNVMIDAKQNSKYYRGRVVINNLLVDLSKILQITNLNTITIPGEVIPSVKILTASVKTANKRLNLAHIIITDITTTSAKIKGDGQFYSEDSFTLTYSSDSRIDLATVLTTKNLGDISINGALQLTSEQIQAVVLAKNPNLDGKGISISEINMDKSTALISSDNIIYRGHATVNFTIINKDSININDFNLTQTKTNKVGTLKSTWASDDLTLLANWNNYALNWEEFTDKFTTLAFGANSFFSVYCNTYTDQKLEGAILTLKTNAISNNHNDNSFALNYYYDGGKWFGAFIQLDGYINIWHDNQNIYLSCNWSIDTINCFRDRIFAINLQGAIFST